MSMEESRMDDLTGKYQKLLDNSDQAIHASSESSRGHHLTLKIDFPGNGVDFSSTEIAPEFPIAILVVDQNKKLVTWNEIADEWFSINQCADAQDCIHALCDSPQLEKCSLCPVAQSIENGAPHKGIIQAQSKKKLQYFRIEAMPVKDGAGNSNYTVVMLENITREIRAIELSSIQRDLGMALSGVTELKKGLTLCLEAIMQASDLESGGIYLFNDDFSSLDLLVSKGLPGDFVQATAHYSPDSPNVYLVNLGKPIYTEHLNLEALLSDPENRDLIRVAAVLPFQHGGKVIGNINVASHIHEEIPEETRIALEEIAAQTGSIVVRLKSQEQINHYREHLEELVANRTQELRETNRHLQTEINERRRVEERLRIERHLMDTLFDTVPGLIFLYDKDMRLIRWNNMLEKITGYSPAELRQKSILDFFDQANREIIINEAEKAFSEGLVNLEADVLTRNGEHIPIYFSGVSSDLGGESCILGVGIDNSRRKQAEGALRESESHYRGLFENSPLSIIEEDFTNVKKTIDMLKSKGVADFLAYFEQHPDSLRQMVETIQVLAVNSVTLALYGIKTKDEFTIGIEMDPSSVAYDPAAVSFFSTELATLASGHLRFEGEVLKRTPAGRSFNAFVSVSVAPGYEQTWSKVLISVIDITPRVEVERQVKAALEEKEVLLREVHHRVKNNLQAIISLISLKLDQLDDLATRVFLQEIEEQARTMALVYEQLYQSNNLARIDMEPYLRQLAFNVQEAFGGRRDIQIEVKTCGVSLEVALAMPCGLIVNELVTNALKHAFTGKNEPGYICVELNQENGGYQLIVSDNGIGLPDNDSNHDAPTLGLNLVNLWATHQLGGTMHVESGEGTTFFIQFPQKKRKPETRG